MSERGVFAVDRGIWDHPLLQSRDPFSRREAWIWLLSAATWKERTVFVDGKRMTLGRGQLAHSIRFMAEAWGWPKSNVSRFLSALRADTMIGTEGGTGITIITICNYDKYQRVSLPDRDTTGTQGGTKPGHDRDKEEGREYRKDTEANASAPAAPELDLEPADEEPRAKLFRKGKTILVSFGVAEKRTGALIGQWLKSRNDPIGLLAAIQYARDQSVADPVSYISAIVHSKDKPNGPIKKLHPADEALQLAEQAREFERQAGFGR